MQTVLDPPQIIAVGHGQTGQLKVRVFGDMNRRGIQARIKDATGGEFDPRPQLIGIGGKTGTPIQLPGFPSHTQSLGGSRRRDDALWALSQSDWSGPVSKIAL